MKKSVLIMVHTICLLATTVFAEEFGTSIPMQELGADTFYVATEIEGLGVINFMVDTGSGYAIINEDALAILVEKQSATYVKDLEGILADDSRMVVPVYSIKQMNIGGQCDLQNIEVAVFPGKTRQILGLSALRQAAPFIFSMNPPELVLSNCDVELVEVQPDSDLATDPPESISPNNIASPS